MERGYGETNRDIVSTRETGTEETDMARDSRGERERDGER